MILTQRVNVLGASERGGAPAKNMLMLRLKDPVRDPTQLTVILQ